MVLTDRAIVAAKDKFVRSQNGTLDSELSTQHYGKQLGSVSRYSEVSG